MNVLWIIVAAGLPHASISDAPSEVSRTTLVHAKNALVDAALLVRRARMDWEEAEARLEEAEAGLEAAHAQQGRALDQSTPWDGARALSSAELKWRTALKALDVRGGRLSRSEKRLQAAQAALGLAEKALADS